MILDISCICNFKEVVFAIKIISHLQRLTNELSSADILLFFKALNNIMVIQASLAQINTL